MNIAMTKISLLGETSLHQKSMQVDPKDPENIGIIESMIDAMNAHKGVGIAAPQIGINKRIIAFGFEKNTRYPDEPAIPLTVLINPEFEVLNDEMTYGWEGCLSIPKIRGLIGRHQTIRYWGYDVQNQRIEVVASGFHARVVQHEIDHLDGLLFLSRVNDMRNLVHEDRAVASMA